MFKCIFYLKKTGKFPKGLIVFGIAAVFLNKKKTELRTSNWKLEHSPTPFEVRLGLSLVFILDINSTTFQQLTVRFSMAKIKIEIFFYLN